MLGVMTTADIIRATATPAVMATNLSRGRWQMASHLRLIDLALTDMLAGRTGRTGLIIEAPPRHGKSELISRWLPAWFLTTWPDKRVILTSYGDALSRSWGRKVRDEVNEHGGLLGVSVSDASGAADAWDIRGRDGGMQVAGVGGPLTGRGANLLIVDDPVKNAEEAASEVYRDKIWDWWQSTASTRLEPDGFRVVIATRWHPEDLTGRLLIEEANDWTRLHMPAIGDDGAALWPERWSLPKLEGIRRRIDRYWWSALYQQAPIRPGTCEFPGEYFEHPGLWCRVWPRCDVTVAAIDPSKGKDARKGDYSAIAIVGWHEDGTLYVRCDMARRPVTAIIEDAVELCRQQRLTALGVEANQFQELLADELDRAFVAAGVLVPPCYRIDNKINKALRVRRIGPYLAQQRLRFFDDAGTRAMVKQLEEFPLGAHDDGPDALEMALRLLGDVMAEQHEYIPSNPGAW